eukprot:scaffold8123_cov66-Phaeocystis_antarctica.AAC.14
MKDVGQAEHAHSEGIDHHARAKVPVEYAHAHLSPGLPERDCGVVWRLECRAKRRHPTRDQSNVVHPLRGKRAGRACQEASEEGQGAVVQRPASGKGPLQVTGGRGPKVQAAAGAAACTQEAPHEPGCDLRALEQGTPAVPHATITEKAGDGCTRSSASLISRKSARFNVNTAVCFAIVAR